MVCASRLETSGATWAVCEGVEIELLPLVTYTGGRLALVRVKGKMFTPLGVASAVEELDVLVLVI